MTKILYSRDKVGRFTKGTNQGVNEANPNWKGDAASVYAVHAWLIRHHGSPNECENCSATDAKRYDWANISGSYRRLRSDFMRLCRSCHVKMDKNWLKKQQTPYRKYLPTINNICVKCSMHFMSKDKGRQYCSKTCWYERNK